MSDPYYGNGQPLVGVSHLKKYFPVRKGVMRRVVAQVKAVDDVSFVGEGCAISRASASIMTERLKGLGYLE